MESVLSIAIVLTLAIFVGTFAISIVKQVIDLKKKKNKDKNNVEEVKTE